MWLLSFDSLLEMRKHKKKTKKKKLRIEKASVNKNRAKQHRRSSTTEKPTMIPVDLCDRFGECPYMSFVIDYHPLERLYLVCHRYSNVISPSSISSTKCPENEYISKIPLKIYCLDPFIPFQLSTIENLSQL